MKREFLIALFIAFYSLALAQPGGSNSLYIDDPNNWWGYSSRGTIEKAQVSIRPAGAYTEIGLYMTISARDGSMEHYPDQLEIVMRFDLPEGSIMHDSWLWVGQDIMQGIIIDKDEATAIYEGIVNRRQDPSLLKKTGDRYEFRIYPMINGQDERKVKITYLVPNDIIGNLHSFPLPTNILNTSLTMPNLDVLVYSNSTFGPAMLSGHPGITFAGDTANPWLLHGTIPATVLSSNAELKMTYERSANAQAFIGIHPTSATDGYYQLICPVDHVVPRAPKKLLFVIEQFDDADSYSDMDIANGLKSFLHDHLTPADSFFIFVQGQNQIYNTGSVWMPADSLLIEQAIVHIATPLAQLSSSNTYDLLVAAQTFAHNNGGGELYLITNEDQPFFQWGQNQINNIIPYPVSVVYHQARLSYSSSSAWPPSPYYTLITGSGGSFVSRINGQGFQNYNYTYRNVPLNELLVEAFAQNHPPFSQVDITPDNGNGYTQDSYDIAANYNNQGTFVQTGKYYGGIPSAINITAFNYGIPVNQSWTVPIPYYDTLTHKIWADQYIQNRSQISLNNNIIRRLNDTSIYHRVLWDYTAFLCLEPHDTLPACESCDPEGFDNENTVGIDSPDEMDALALQAAPNPFAGQLNISVALAGIADGETVEVHIFNLLGEVIQVLKVTKTAGQHNYALTWDGTTIQGHVAAAGTYLIKMSTSAGSASMKVVKL